MTRDLLAPPRIEGVDALTFAPVAHTIITNDVERIEYQQHARLYTAAKGTRGRFATVWAANVFGFVFHNIGWLSCVDVREADQDRRHATTHQIRVHITSLEKTHSQHRRPSKRPLWFDREFPLDPIVIAWGDWSAITLSPPSGPPILSHDGDAFRRYWEYVRDTVNGAAGSAVWLDTTTLASCHWLPINVARRKAETMARLLETERGLAVGRQAQPEEHPMTTPNVTPSPPQSWRSVCPVHPCADVFPLLSEPDLEALAKDIKANGLRQPITLWKERPRGQIFVLDGRNRLDALARVNPRAVAILREFVGTSANANGGACGGGPGCSFDLIMTSDPAAYVISINIKRRHLTKEQQAELIVKTIEAAKNERAKVARSFSPSAGKKGGSTKDPVLTAAVEEGRKHGISKRTVQNARAKLNGKQPAPRKKIGVSKTPPSSAAKPLAPSTSSPSMRVSIHSGPVSVHDNVESVPREKWPELVSVRRSFVAVHLLSACRELVRFVYEADQMIDALGYHDVHDFVRRGLALDPQLVPWVLDGLHRLDPDDDEVPYIKAVAKKWTNAEEITPTVESRID